MTKRTPREEFENIQWIDLLLHIGAGVLTTLMLWVVFNHWGLILGCVANLIFWPMRELAQSGTRKFAGLSLKKHLEAFAPTPFSIVLAVVLW